MHKFKFINKQTKFHESQMLVESVDTFSISAPNL